MLALCDRSPANELESLRRNDRTFLPHNSPEDSSSDALRSRDGVRTLGALRDHGGCPASDEAGCALKRGWRLMSAFSNRPFRVKHFQTIRRCSVAVAHGLVLLF